MPKYFIIWDIYTKIIIYTYLFCKKGNLVHVRKQKKKIKTLQNIYICVVRVVSFYWRQLVMKL